MWWLVFTVIKCFRFNVLVGKENSTQCRKQYVGISQFKRALRLVRKCALVSLGCDKQWEHNPLYAELHIYTDENSYPAEEKWLYEYL